MPWDDFISELVSPEADGRVHFATFLNRYSVEGNNGGWKARLLGALHATLCERDLRDTLAFFDTNQDGVVTVDELEQVCIHRTTNNATTRTRIGARARAHIHAHTRAHTGARFLQLRRV